MKQGIHPEYVECTVVCACGNTWKLAQPNQPCTLRSVPHATLGIKVKRRKGVL